MMMMNASFIAGMTIRQTEGADSGTGRLRLPAWTKKRLKIEEIQAEISRFIPTLANASVRTSFSHYC